MATDTLQTAPRRPRKRIAKGPPRPSYLGGDDTDRVMIMVVAMLSELLTLRDRVQTHELLLDRDGTLTLESLQAFRPSPELEAQREAEHLAVMRRIFRVLRDEFEDYGEAPT